MAARLDVHEGEETKACSKRMPSRASLSSVGVRTTGSPYAEAWGQLQSSAIARRTFGRASGAGSALAPAAAHGASVASRAAARAFMARTLPEPPAPCQLTVGLLR